MAHEYGHHVQHLLGWPEREENQHNTYAELELEADCFSGIFIRHQVARDALTPFDVTDAEADLLTIGSDTPWMVEGSHGTGEQRLEWFQVGFDNGSVSTCAQVFDSKP